MREGGRTFRNKIVSGRRDSSSFYKLVIQGPRERMYWTMFISRPRVTPLHVMEMFYPGREFSQKWNIRLRVFTFQAFTGDIIRSRELSGSSGVDKARDIAEYDCRSR